MGDDVGIVNSQRQASLQQNTRPPSANISQDELDYLNTSIRGAASDEEGYMVGVIGLLEMMAMGKMESEYVRTKLIGNFGMTTGMVDSLINQVRNGVSPTGAFNAAMHTGGLTGQDGGLSTFNKDAFIGITSQSFNPDDQSFWDDFAVEWQYAKDKMAANDQFLKEKLDPVFETYQERLAGESTDPTFAPINLKFGDFSTSFTTNRSRQAANDILGSEIAQADIMKPHRSDLDYTQKLLELAKMERGFDLSEAQIKAGERDDSGSWLDAITDVVDLGGSIGGLAKTFGFSDKRLKRNIVYII